MTDAHQEARDRQPFPTGSPAILNVVPWPDPILESQGHKPGRPYVEAVWLGVLGPSTTLCWLVPPQPNRQRPAQYRR